MGGGNDSTLRANDIHKFPFNSDSIDDDDKNGDSGDSSDSSDSSGKGGKSLASKSAPALHSLVNEVESPEQQATPTRINKSYSTSSHAISNSLTMADDSDIVTRTRSAVFHSPSVSPVRELTTPPSSPRTHQKTHHKSLSVSNVVLDYDIIELTETDDNINHLSMPDRHDDTRSRGSSFISTSSKMDTTDESSGTEEEEEDDDFDPPAPHEGAMLTSIRKIINSDEDVISSEDDHLDGGRVGARIRIKGRTDRRFSEVKVTMIDDYSESDEDSSHIRPLPRSSTADDALSHTSQSTEDHRNSPDEPMSFLITKKSDNEVSGDSLNNSFSGEYSKTTPGMSPILTRDNIQSFTPNGSPRLKKQDNESNPKKTVTKLQSLLKIDQENVSVFDPIFDPISDDSDREGRLARRSRKSQTLPVHSPNGQRRSSLLSDSSALSKKDHPKVSRNASTASDSKVYYKTAESSSLDFVKPPEGKISPRLNLHHSQSDVSNLQSPHSPLFFSKRSSDERNTEALLLSPKSHGSPLEKRVSKSADDLLSDKVTDEHKTDNQSPTKNKKKDDTNVRLLRFEPLPEDETNTDEETNRKDLKSYYGIEQEKEPSKKGAFKLFRRDSKKDKKPKKYDTSNSIDPTNNNNQLKSKTQQSPIQRKSRSHTIHGDSNYPAIDETPKQLPAKRMSQTLVNNKQTTPTPVKEDSVSPGREVELSPVPLSPVPLSPSDFVEIDNKSMSINIEEFPELMPSEEADISWNRTVDRRLRKQMSKHEKGRQGVIYDWITTERHIYRAYQILKKVFYNKFKSELKMSDDELNQLFPSLDTLLDISQEFIQRLQDRQRQSGTLIQDISDILHDQFTGAKGERMKKAYTHFICLYPATMELYRDMEKKRQKFNRLITVIYQNKVCERKKLPDFYLLITQRVSKYVEMMKKLVKETEAMKLDHYQRVKETSCALKDLVNSIDRGVYEFNSHKELTDIQTRLELHIPKLNTKSKKLKGIKSLDFTAQNRFLLKRGDATWQGHGKQIGTVISIFLFYL